MVQAGKVIKTAKTEIRVVLKMAARAAKGAINNLRKLVKAAGHPALRAAEARVIAEMVIEARPRYAGGRVRRLQIY